MPSGFRMTSGCRQVEFRWGQFMMGLATLQLLDGLVVKDVRGYHMKRLRRLPSLPISAADGETIIRSIDGKQANDDWQGDKDAPLYKVGPGPGVVNLTYTVCLACTSHLVSSKARTT